MRLHSPARPYLKAAQKAWAADDPRGALRELAQGIRADAGHKPLYRLALKCLQRLGAEQEVALIQIVLADFRAAESFYMLGLYYANDQNFELAIPLLEHAHALDVKRLDAATTLAQCYTARFRPQDACDLLRNTGLQGDFWATYEFYWAALLCNRPPVGITEFINDARLSIAHANLEATQRDNLAYALDKLAQALARLQAFPDPRPLVQDWHFVQYGAAILDFFDDRTAEDGLSVAGGRWVALWATSAHVAMLLHKLAHLLIALEREPQHVIALPDRNSEIIGRAAALVLDLPFALAAEEGGAALAQSHSLLIAADQRELRDKALLPVLPGQTIFALNLHWLHHGGLTPDIAGLLSQALYLPWEGALQFDLKTRQVNHTAPDNRPAEVIAQELSATAPEQDAHFEETLAFYRARAAYLKGGRHGGDLRLPFHADSPVPGSYFA